MTNQVQKTTMCYDYDTCMMDSRCSNFVNCYLIEDQLEQSEHNELKRDDNG